MGFISNSEVVCYDQSPSFVGLDPTFSHSDSTNTWKENSSWSVEAQDRIRSLATLTDVTQHSLVSSRSDLDEIITQACEVFIEPSVEYDF